MAQTKILVVEDEGIVALEIQSRLINMGYDVHDLVATGEAAIERALATHPDLVLMDIRLKGNIDGVVAADHIRLISDIPVIFLTAYADADTLRRAKVTEPYGYILKPFEERELHIAIEMALYKYQMEQKLKEHERWLATTLNNIRDAIITTDDQGLINFMNPLAVELTEWESERAMSLPIASVFQLIDSQSKTPMDSFVSARFSQEVIRSPQPDPLLVTRKGAEFPVQYQATPIRNHQGKVIGTVLVFRNMTEQRRIERELLRTQKLESLGLLAGGVAHDFNNLLSAIVNNIGLVKARLRPVEDIYKRLEFVERAVWRGAELTQQLLTFAKGGAPVKRVTAIDPIIQESADLALHDSNVSFAYSRPDHLWSVEVDTGQIGQAFHNLLLNAREAMPMGGEIMVRAENVTMGPEQHFILPPGHYVRILVQDHGVGIPQENLTKIFDPYFTTKSSGNGLGLTTTYSIITRHDGHIQVESELGKGTVFILHLPAIVEEHNAPQLPIEVTQNELSAEGNGRILIMDDDELIREAAGAFLELLGYSHEAAGNGNEAVVLYQRALESGKPFDAVILDLTVRGGMGGRESLERLLTIDPSVKAIVSSGYCHDPIVANYQSYGFKGVVSKPYTIEEMGEMLYKLIHFDS
jgi:PAS domain S-box-containing protein